MRSAWHRRCDGDQILLRADKSLPRLRVRSKVAVMALDVCAHITGTVWKIVVKQGESVAEEQQLVILESMKMEMPVEAPEAGVVEEIVVEEGQTVEEGDVLIRLAT